MDNAIQFVVFTIGNMYFATKKGFNPWAWILAGSFLGFLSIWFLPSADPKVTDLVTREKRRKRANSVGIIVSILGVFINLCLYVFFRNLHMNRPVF